MLKQLRYFQSVVRLGSFSEAAAENFTARWSCFRKSIRMWMCRSLTATMRSSILHYCVGNIPSAFAQTASTTLANATLPFAVQLAGKGAEQALADNKHLRRGLTTYAGKLTLLETAKKLEMPFTSPEEAIGM